MDAASVVLFWRSACAERLNICIDGGWAVDALLGCQTRQHNDLDIALPADQVPRLMALLAADGMRIVDRSDSWEHNFVLEDDMGRIIDVHSYVLNSDGTNAGGVSYEAQHLTGEGLILGEMIRCVPPEWLVSFHTGYDVDENDWHDVRLLCSRFNLEIPIAYEGFIQNDTGTRRQGNPDLLSPGTNRLHRSR